MSDVVIIGRIIRFHLSSYEKPSSPYCVAIFSGETAGEFEIDHSWTLFRLQLSPF